MPTTAFLTDSTLCIGCKACEVACKEWNEVPADGFAWSGLSYDNTLALGHSTLAPREVRRDDDRVRRRRQLRGEQRLVGVFVRRLQALRERRLPRSLPDRLDRAHGVRRRVRAARRLQRLRLLRRRLPVRRHRPAARRWPGVQVHVLLRPAEAPGCSRRARRRVRRSRSCSARLDDLRRRADDRVDELHARGIERRRASTIRATRSVGGIHALFIVRGDPRAYNLPAQPEVPTVYLRDGWRSAAARRRRC